MEPIRMLYLSGEQLAQLGAGTVKSGVYKKRSLATAFGDKIAELQDLTIDHEFDKFLLVLFHFFFLSIVVQGASCLIYHLKRRKQVEIAFICQFKVLQGYFRVFPAALFQIRS